MTMTMLLMMTPTVSMLFVSIIRYKVTTVYSEPVSRSKDACTHLCHRVCLEWREMFCADIIFAPVYAGASAGMGSHTGAANRRVLNGACTSMVQN